MLESRACAPPDSPDSLSDCSPYPSTPPLPPHPTASARRPPTAIISAGKLSDDECARLGGAMTITNFTNGTNVVTEGEKGDDFFIISAGDAEVWRDGALVCPLKRGDYFGGIFCGFVQPIHASIHPSNFACMQSPVHPHLISVCSFAASPPSPFVYFFHRVVSSRAHAPPASLCLAPSHPPPPETALLSSSQRLATVKAKFGLQTLSLGRERFLQLFGSNRFQVQFAKRGAVAAEKHEEDEKQEFAAGATEKTAATRDWIAGIIQANDLFKGLEADQLSTIAEAMYRVEVKAGQSLMKQGDLADNFYVVESGNFAVLVGHVGQMSAKNST